MTVAAKGPKIPESAFQAQVLHLAALKGWRSAHFRTAQDKRGRWLTAVAGDGKGFPDTVLLRGDRIVIAELKAELGRTTAEQREWLDAWRTAGAEVFIWRPSDFDHIVEVLS